MGNRRISRRLDEAGKRVALGFRVHTGWAAMVAVSGAFPHVEVLHRSRVELLGGGVNRFVYHEASELNLAEAAEVVRRVEEAAREGAGRAIREAVERLRSEGREVTSSGVAGGATKVPGELEKVLASHALIHAAEGELFRQALMAASEACGLEVTVVRERDLWVRAAEVAGESAEVVRQTVGAMGKVLGPPWSEDQRVATVTALLALARG